MKKIYTSSEVAQCLLRKAVLESCGIACEVRNEALSQLYGEVPFSQVWPELWVVDDARTDEALAILDQALSREAEEIEPPSFAAEDGSSQPIGIRDEREGDAEGVRYVNLSAFGQPAEADIVDSLRARGCVTLSLVAVRGENVVGHVLFTPVTIEPAREPLDAAGLAPVAVLPEFQCRGIGTWLVVRGLNRLRDAGTQVVVVLGNPAFYNRFGFRPASRLGLRSEYDVADEEFMALAFADLPARSPASLALYQPEFREL